MATLETQYKNYITSNPDSTLSFEEWKNNFSQIYGLDSHLKPFISDDFQIGPDGAFENEELKNINKINFKYKLLFPDSIYNIKNIIRNEKDNRISHVIIDTVYGFCKIDKKNLFKFNKITIEHALNKEDYLFNQIKEKFPNIIDKYKIIKFNGFYDIIIINNYGMCKITYKCLLKGSFGNINNAFDKTQYFIRQSKEIFKNKYNYDKTVYKLAKDKVIITCKIHGDFFTTPDNFLRKFGCRKCGRKNIQIFQSENPTGWSISNWFKAACKSKNFHSFKVYILECSNESEKFYKIGRTFNKIYKRYKSKSALPYNYKIIMVFEFVELTEENCLKCFNLEKKLQRKNKKFKYVPNIIFGGMQECYKNLVVISDQYT